MNLRPLSDRIIVLCEKAEEVSKGGIILPENAREKPQRGKILAVGPGRNADDGSYIVPQVKVGDTVLYGKYSGVNITENGVEYIFMRETDVLAVVIPSIPDDSKGEQ